MKVEFPARLPIPGEVVRIARRLEDAGFETWCVGGAVRDNLLHLENKDFDLATAATPVQVQELFRRTFPIGVEHGTVAVLDDHRRPHEVTTFRRDVKTDGRHAVVEFGVSLDEDLARRDFTINAIAHHPMDHQWRDPFDGQGDLARGLLRAVGEPDRRFREDYLRILRAVRFSTRLGFAIDRATWSAACAAADGLKHLSAERVRAEWFRSLELAKRPSSVAELWKQAGALDRWLPEFGTRGTGGGESMFADLDRFPARDPVLMTAHFSSDPIATLTRLRCSNAEVERGRAVALHRNLWPDATSGRAVRRWMAAVGPAADDLVTLTGVSDPAHGPALGAAVRRERASRAPLGVADLAVTGNDLREVGVPPGPEMGRVLRQLLEAVLDEPSRNSRGQLLELARNRPAEPRA